MKSLKVFGFGLFLIVSSLIYSASSWANTSVFFDPAIYENFEQSPRQIVIVSLQDEGPSLATSRPQAFRGTEKQSVLRSIQKQKLDIASQLSFGKAAIVSELPQFRAMALDVNRADVDTLRSNHAIRSIHTNRLNRVFIESSIPFIGADTFHDGGYGGAGTAVAVLDSPVRYWNGAFGTCDAIGESDCRIYAWENFADEDIMSVAEGEAHGTNVSGIVLGVAPETKILSLNVFEWYDIERDYRASDRDILEALNWVAEHAEEYNIVAVNMSLGHERENPMPCNNEGAYADAIKTLYSDYGIVSAISSGNDGQTNAIGGPACISAAMSVGAQYDSQLSATLSFACIDLVPTMGKIACFSNLNGALDIVAPGIGLDAGGINDYSGTSMSAPHVAGSVALMQSVWKDRDDSYKSAAEAKRWLHFMAFPKYHNGVVYQQLNLDESKIPKNHDPYMLPEFIEENNEAVIPQDGESFSTQLDVASDETISSAYLHLEVIHEKPDAIEATLTSPDGSEVVFTLPSNQTNFNAIIGRDHLPGLFDSLKGENAGGTWRLSLRDTSAGGAVSVSPGYYLNATLWLSGSECVPQCDGIECGHDLCGGICGACGEGQHCNVYQECLFEGEFCKGDSCGSATEVAVPSSETYSGNGLACADLWQGSCGGLFAPDKVYTFSPDRPANLNVYAMKEGMLVYIKKDGCNGEEIACERPSSRGLAEISTTLDAGTYYLFVEDYNAGDFEIGIDICAPDCSGRDCGDDGCGGSCGNCEENAVCNELGTCACEFSACEDLCCAEEEVCNEASCCLPECDGKTCGDDGCGGNCGTCADGASCSDGACECEFAECDGTCCEEGATCFDDACCIPNCADKECGDDSCGGSCGDCRDGRSCTAGVCDITTGNDSGSSGCIQTATGSSSPGFAIFTAFLLLFGIYRRSFRSFLGRNDR